jgi:hypothetical protein
MKDSHRFEAAAAAEVMLCFVQMPGHNDLPLTCLTLCAGPRAASQVPGPA